ncbi:hypothetical protein BGX34_000407 [Mortierella sp. NVP85]|nr:hypothetical protein BGX34_000407 [Mortierella sp. NVP85]
MVEIIYPTSIPGAEAGVPIPLGPTRRYILLSFGIIMTIIGLSTTYIFQRISKKDNNLRQRGRYLVPLQGYCGTVFFATLYIYQAFKYRIPCLLLYYGSYFGLLPFVLFIAGRAWRLLSRYERNNAIYQSRFAEPIDLDELDRTQTRRSASDKPAITTDNASTSHPHLRTTVSPSDTLVSNSLRQTRPQPINSKRVQHFDSKNAKVFELTDQSLDEIARMKRWYNRYRTATEKEMQLVAVLYLVFSTIIAIAFQIVTPTMSFNPLYFECHSGKEYAYPYINAILFVFIVSPFMVFQLKGISDGFGIRNELIFITIFSAPCIALYFAMPAWFPDFTREYLDRTTWMAMILVTCHVTGIIIPIVHHYRTHPCTARTFPKQRHNMAPGFGLAMDVSKENIGAGDHVWDIPLEGQFHAKHDISQAQSLPATTQESERIEHHVPGTPYDSSLSDPSQKNSVNNINHTLKNLIRNPKLERFGFGSSHHGANLNSMKSDWVEFVRVLEDRTLFDRLNAFTVREFCAENTRFLYEVSRLEKRAMQYERLRTLSGGTQDSMLERSGQRSAEKDSESTNMSSALPQSAKLTKSPSTDTRHSFIAPLPTHFSSPAIQVDTSQPPHRIKKIVSASSVSSTQPILGLHRSSSSFFNDSEPSSPGSPPRPSMMHFGSGSTAIEYADSFPEPSRKGTASTVQTPSSPMDIIDSPTTAFGPLPMPPTLVIQFEYVYNTFIKRSARLELNLSYRTYQEIHERVKRGEWRSGMFDGAIHEIQELLFRDVWPKFVTSSHGLNYNGTSTPTDSAHLQEIGAATSSLTSARATAAPDSRSSLYQPSDQMPSSPQRTLPMPMLQMTSSTSSLSKVGSKVIDGFSNDNGSNAVGSSGAASSSKSLPRNQGNNEDVSPEEPSRLGLKAWLTKTSRTGLTAAALVSRECGSEEAVGIIEQSRKSMIARRSDTSGIDPNSGRST